MGKMRTDAATLGVLAVLAVSAVSCGGSDASSEREHQDPSPSASAGQEPTATEPSDAERSTGCGKPPDLPLMEDRRDGDAPSTFDVDGGERSYRLAVPPDYDPDVAVPLVLNLHGRTYSALRINRYTAFPQAAVERGMIVVSPDAIDESWDVDPTGPDGRFLDALLDDVMSRYCVDEDRVHRIGMSLGGWRAAASACAYPGRFASIAVVAIEMFPGTCEPMPVIAFHGTADTEIAFGAGGGTIDPADAAFPLPGALDNMGQWAGNAGCGLDPATEEVGTDVLLRRYPDCDDGAEVELYAIVGGGHSWPGAAREPGVDTPTTHTISATDLALDFFEHHPDR